MINDNFPDERQWLSSLKEGNKEAFDVIYSFYANSIYSRLMVMVKDPAKADELLQDIFMKVWEKRALINPELSFKSWLYKIAENIIYDYYRRLAMDTKMKSHLVETFSELYNHTEDYILNKERTELLSKAISRLPLKRQKVFRLCKLEGKSYEEVAALLDISESTVSNHLVKATKSIKDYVFFNSREFLILIIAFYLKK